MPFKGETYTVVIKSKKEIHIDGLHEELCLIVENYKTGTTKIKSIPVSNCLLLTSNNASLKNALLKNDNYIIS